MRNAYILLLIALLASCTKEIRKMPEQQDNVLVCKELEPPPGRLNRTSNIVPSVSPMVIYLDFDGALVSNSSWNVGADLYLESSGLSPIQEDAVVENVSDDFSPFNVIVTKDSTVYANAEANNRQRCIITTSYQWFGSNAGGVSYIGSSSWGDGTPCFVFSSLLNFNLKMIKEATSHEFGHTMGLRHQAKFSATGQLMTEYNSGSGSDEKGFAPIMGVGYYKPIVNWFNGLNAYGGAQDDFSILTSRLGLVQDDFRDKARGSQAILTGTINGVLNTPDDVDVIRIPADASSFNLTTSQFVPIVTMSTNFRYRFITIKALTNPWETGAVSCGRYTLVVN